MANQERNPGGEQPSDSDPTLAAILAVWATLGKVPRLQPSGEEQTPRPPRASDIRANLVPDQLTPKDIRWIQTLLRDEPLVAMTTKGAKATIPMYSTFTEEPDGKLKFLFRSFESTDHGTVIDEVNAQGTERAAVQLLAYRSGELNLGVELFGYARRVTEEEKQQYEDIYQRTRDRRKHNEGEQWGNPTYPMYVIDEWELVQSQTRLRDETGQHRSNDKIAIPLEQLRGFSAPPPDDTTESDQSWR